MAKMLIVSKCLECPHHTKVSDPGSADSFDASDEAMLCKLTGKYNAGDRTFEHRPIVRASRWQHEFEVAIPEWCPLTDASMVAQGKAIPLTNKGNIKKVKVGKRVK